MNIFNEIRKVGWVFFSVIAFFYGNHVFRIDEYNTPIDVHRACLVFLMALLAIAWRPA